MIKKGSFTRYTIILQVFVLLFAIATIPACSASQGEIPSLPLLVEGEVSQGDNAAPAGTEVTAVLDGNQVGSTTLQSDGIISKENQLAITCEPDDYKNLKFYVDGTESDMYNTAEMADSQPGDVIELSLKTASTGSEDTGSSDGSSGGMASSSTSTDGVDQAATSESTGDESELDATASAGTSSSEETAGEDVPAPESQTTSMTGIGVMAIVLVSLLGIIAFLIYKKED
ncbi:hypothetical protein [Methanohalophilus halophilus]|uniref:Uncharacterized protein n=1 Tax=Methanohalophilus halophilus TaxID=2177 RepID=A0A1L3Q2N4_9EURY|nr:hypothetical protein [Methanohalophilus halophilus]APH39093.1 hypothetical protein BHR79_06070 [Methanohalophilus halophilus]RNI09851.1 hypothetical protein EFE40_04185 [Methanohalophilus halophilus]SDW93278.1 hypothetical protein SAMN04515625_1925 [Methanohalophilus halophilus]